MGSRAVNPADFYSVALTNVFQHKILKAFKDSEILNQKLKESTSVWFCRRWTREKTGKPKQEIQTTVPYKGMFSWWDLTNFSSYFVFVLHELLKTGEIIRAHFFCTVFHWDKFNYYQRIQFHQKMHPFCLSGKSDLILSNQHPRVNSPHLEM